MNSDALVATQSQETVLHSQPKSLLYNRTFLWIYAGSTLSITGEGFHSIVIGYWVLTTTGSAKAMMTIMLIQMISGLVLGSIAGTLADRYNRRMIMLSMDILRALLIAGVAAVFTFGEGNAWWWLIALLALISAASQFHNPAFASSLIYIVGKDQIQRATSLMQITDTLARLAGLSLGGAAVAIFGGPASVIGVSVAFIISACCVSMSGSFPKHERLDEEKMGFWADFKHGLSYIRTHSIARSVSILLPSIMVFFVASMMVFQVLAVTVWQATPWQFGMLEAIIPIGYASGAGLIAFMGSKLVKRGLWVSLAMLLAGPNLMLLASIHHVYLSIPFVFLIGFILAIGTVIVTVMLRTEVNAEYQGRVFGTIGSLSSLATPVGIILSGVFSDLYGADLVLMLNGLGLTLVAAICVYFLKELRKYD
ncbi:MFS family permease [Paenibacillus anaericanus]|uniref:MFS transporter n=1 Tax=Paenibacillus anaericanus TaxID=170367 RepID=UPI00277EEF1C|nr:MFS transporter [Paenibacillus anaericanus]MDQ0090099.1 MFS family permease [Paenibacillus anaericanus]